ncbi:glycoside hydrolase family 26 protein [Trebonia sp.]|uniref:glycoside hydrolase family 26 protein n=1 Tax=Trebonia sp. TaxID=2767075 RepID=UPI00261A9713|nr:glycosyl hydrolase [Trebonia sp.]
MFEPGVPLSYTPVEKFAAATGIQPRIVLWYGGWGDPFWTEFAHEVAAHGALPLVQVNPGQATMASVAAGKYDAYLRSYADAVRKFGGPVVIGFAPEMNGTWYQWGRGHTPPSEWVAAWRHIVTLFRAQGARNVIWLWTVNAVNAAEKADLRDWWPGASYVTWVGIDGYFYFASETFASVFGRTVAEIRSFTQDPVLISETATGPVAGPSKIAELFAGVKADHLVGFVWFDQAQHDGIYHQDWRLEDNPTALAAFRAAVKKYK